MIKTILRDPLSHFIAIAIALFVIFEALNPQAPEDVNTIVVSEGRVEQLHQRFVKVWQRTPTQEEMDNLISNYVMDEIYAREARSLGLDSNDGVIRKRLRQKMEFMIQDIAGASPPSDEELKRFFVEHQKKYQQQGAFSFSQVFMSHDVPQKNISIWVEQQQNRINKGLEPEGSSSLLPKVLQKQRKSHIARQFGNDFAQALSVQPFKQWTGPIRSGYGLHFVYINDVESGNLPDFAVVKDKVLADWRYQKNLEQQQAFEEELLSRYDIKVSRPTLVAGDY
ncbi:peptidyl-prolyl cis-trans isomerase [Thalassotalea sp. PS06]|uniref:peptidylprolyl isomerase n=1 Tax=Thalassotalea sp. PS06 TaxID=2594005 RepID=UPI001161DBE6|nr:peptidylprolyl isomerase [Thalassotalea sp. PS06]QDP01922.1 peptidyl-prolyl cis-trans isomerase [Thalassotalea sp. PS06]